jgi:MFS transporter, FHS family, L-fucose permease
VIPWPDRPNSSSSRTPKDHYRYGVVAQFLDFGARVCAWSFTIQYALDVVGVSSGSAGWYLQAIIIYLVACLVMVYLLAIIRPTRLLFALAALGVVLSLVAVLSPTMLGLIAVIGISLPLSLMFPTIYGVALQGLGRDTRFGAAGPVVAVLGGPILPLVQGLIMDAADTNIGFIVPAICLAFLAADALFDLNSTRHAGPLVTEGAN